MIDIFGDDNDHTLEDLLNIIFDKDLIQIIIDIGYGAIYLNFLKCIINQVDNKK